MAIDVLTRKAAAWDIVQPDDPTIAADLVSRTFPIDGINKGWQQPLLLLTDNVNAMRLATYLRRMEELDVIRSFLSPR